jgi:hypothetical protein
MNGQNDGVSFVAGTQLPLRILRMMIDGSLADSENFANF